MQILITGASGFIGTHLLLALHRSHRIRACVRNPDKLARLALPLEILRVDFRQMTEAALWRDLLEGIDVVINCVGIIAENATQSFRELHVLAPQALFEAAHRAGIRKIIQISALGSDADARSCYHLSKKAADETLSGLDLDWFILRPSIVYGPSAQSMALFHALAALPIQAVIDRGSQPIQPVHVDDLVEAVVACLDEHTKARRIIDVVGPEPIRFVDLLAFLRKRLGKSPAPVVSVRSELATRFGFLGNILSIPALSAEGIQMLSRGNHADCKNLNDLLGHKPCSMQDKLAPPASQAERWHAGLFFLRPLLRYALAFLWIASGLASAFFFPVSESMRWLAALGIGGVPASVALYGLSFVDGVLGILLLIGYRLRTVILLQIMVILGYTLVITIGLPEFWLHPFGPLVKNVPILVASMILWVLEGEKP